MRPDRSGLTGVSDGKSQDRKSQKIHKLTSFTNLRFAILRFAILDPYRVSSPRTPYPSCSIREALTLKDNLLQTFNFWA